MTRTQRLDAVMTALAQGAAIRAEDLAANLGVTPRTIYRDMDALRAAGIDITGTRGKGYQASHPLTLPPVSLSHTELEALALGLAAVAEMGDPGLAKAAQSLAERLDTLLPDEDVRPEDLRASTAINTSGLRHVAPFRAALRSRQCLEITTKGETHTTRPLALRHWGRLWSALTWSETKNTFLHLGLNEIDALRPLPQLFVEEPGKRASDWQS